MQLNLCERDLSDSSNLRGSYDLNVYRNAAVTFSIAGSVATPCSVNAYGTRRRPPRLALEIARYSL